MLRASLIAAALSLPISAYGQTTSHEPTIIVPQGRTVVILPEPRHRVPSQQPIQLTTVNTQVTITDQVASTTMVMTVLNPGGGQQEAQILLPVPEGCTVRSFQLDSLGSEPNAKLLPKEEARRIYNSIVQKSRDPALLEFVGYSLIKSSVFPVTPGGTQTVRLTYDHLLISDNGKTGERIDYVLPRSESLASTGVAWTASVDITSKRPISTVYSPSHELQMDRRDPNHISVKTIGSAAQPGSFRLSYLLQPADSEVSATVMLYPDAEVNGGKGGYFLLLTGLPAKPADADQQMKREVTIVIDRSGSMRGPKIEQAREAALQVVEGLRTGESFNIIDFSDSINSFADKPIVKNEETIVKARSYIKNIQPNGGTNINDALTEALRPDPTPGTLPVVLFLTDGLPTVGQTSESAIRDAAKKMNKAERRIFTFGVGYDVNAPLLTGIAKNTRATSTFVLPEENVEVKVGQVYRRLSGPILASPKLSAIVKGGDVITRPIREVQPSNLNDQFEGDQMVILGQYLDGTAEKLVVEGNFLGKQRSFEFAFDAAKSTTKNSFVPRLWASRKIASLIEEIRQSNADAGLPTVGAPDAAKKELIDEIVRLSTKWGILTEYTAFLAIEPGMVTAAVDGVPSAQPAAAGLRIASGGRGAGGGGGGPARAAEPASTSSALNIDELKAAKRQSASAPAKPKAEAQKDAVGYVLQSRAGNDRGGKTAVNQEVNLAEMQTLACVNSTNGFYTKDMQRVEVTSVCQVHDQTLFLRNNRWVDARILDKEAEAPEKTVEYGTPEYDAILDDLVTKDQQGLLALGGDCYLQYKGQRVLVKAPSQIAE